MYHLRYLRYFLAHKWRVFVLCWEFDVPLRGLLHDLSKLRPSEWFAHAKYFGRDPASRIDVCELDRAWHLHQHRNRHHWHWWLVWSDDGRYSPRYIPTRYRMEMLADWIARADSCEGLQQWWIKYGSKLPIEDRSADWLGNVIMRGGLKNEYFKGGA